MFHGAIWGHRRLPVRRKSAPGFAPLSGGRGLRERRPPRPERTGRRALERSPRRLAARGGAGRRARAPARIGDRRAAHCHDMSHWRCRSGLAIVFRAARWRGRGYADHRVRRGAMGPLWWPPAIVTSLCTRQLGAAAREKQSCGGAITDACLWAIAAARDPAVGGVRRHLGTSIDAPARTTASIRALARRRQAPDARLWRNPGKLRPHLGRRRLPSDERKPGKRRMRPAVAGKQVRTLMPLQPSTVVDDDSCEIGEVRGIARSWRESCFRRTAGTAQVWESTLLSPGVQPLCSWRERRRLIRATTTSGETAGA